MKETLHHFFSRTAYSKEASEHLLRFHRVDSKRFLLIVPAELNDVSDTESLITDLKYLSELDLHPTLLLSSHFLDKSTIENLKDKAPKNVTIFEHSNTESFVEHLIHIAKEHQFYKYTLIHPPMQDIHGQEYNQIHLNNCSVEWNQTSSDLSSWLITFLETLGPATSIQITTAAKLLPELFTTKGAGTMISLGYHFSHLKPEEIAQEKLIELIHKGFNRHLKINALNDHGKPWTAMIEKEYRGAIVVIDYPSFSYLDKIVVSPEYFGRGLGSLLLDELFEKMLELSKNKPKLAWRARHDNPYLNRYASFIRQAAKRFPLKCGTTSDEHYVYHLLGLNENERKEAISIMSQKPSSFNEDQI